ncbi:MAG: hypothetical protein IJ728_14535 [Selenomonadaceae bacterium]|nr:hypothetical protein [Selenomonadaceae bacterium]MBR1730729.1 hypothetical protein [Selenomonadaceae bacterium]
MKNAIQIFNRLILAFMICCLIFSSNALAAEKKISAMNAFREAMLATNNPDERVFKQVITIYTPSAAVHLQFLAQKKNNSSLRVKGTVGFFYNDKLGETQRYNFPFYIDQNKNEMTIYGKISNEWQKYNLPELATVIAESLTTPSQTEIKESINLAKKVELLNETDKHRTMLVHLNGEKIFKMLKDQDTKSNNQNLSSQEVANKELVFNYLESALKKSDIRYTWTVDKENWQTLITSAHLSDFIQQLARIAIDQSDIAKNEEVRNILETISYYGEFRTYTTYLDPKNISSIEIPAEVLNAKQIENILPNNSTTSTEK